MLARIIVVDDLEDNRDLLSRRLQLLGHCVTCAASGKEALHLLLDAPFDLVMLDLMMPEMDGLQVLRAIKESSDDLTTKSAKVT